MNGLVKHAAKKRLTRALRDARHAAGEKLYGKKPRALTDFLTALGGLGGGAAGGVTGLVGGANVGGRMGKGLDSLAYAAGGGLGGGLAGGGLGMYLGGKGGRMVGEGLTAMTAKGKRYARRKKIVNLGLGGAVGATGLAAALAQSKKSKAKEPK